MRITPIAPEARKLTVTDAETRWRVDNIRGKTYIVTTYPGMSKQVFIEREDSHALNGARIRTEILDAIKAAGG